MTFINVLLIIYKQFNQIITVQFQSMNPLYITPRLAIATLSSLQQFQNLKKMIEIRHKSYYNFFNLTNVKLPNQKQSNFKWRGIPFSLSQAIKLLIQIDTYLKSNIANTAIICTSNHQNQQYAKIILKCYVQLCLLSIQPSLPLSNKKTKLLALKQSLSSNQPYFFSSFVQIYRNIKIQLPPVKYLESLEIEPKNMFIPIIEIFNQSRYNDFQSIYYHQIQEQLALYYLNLNKPLQTGIGKRYYDNRPETSYFKKPILVYGDVKIIIYSYKNIKRIQECIIGFNTLNINELTQNNSLILSSKDFYEKSNYMQSYKDDIKIKIKFSDYCDEEGCKKNAGCLDFNRYNEVQGQLEKLNRKRTIQECEKMMSL